MSKSAKHVLEVFWRADNGRDESPGAGGSEKFQYGLRKNSNTGFASVAGMFLTTECAISEIPQPEPAAPMNPSMGGMM